MPLQNQADYTAVIVLSFTVTFLPARRLRNTAVFASVPAVYAIGSGEKGFKGQRGAVLTATAT
ncbi:MAG TPA: hypothetical protein PKY10_10860 [Lentisphaeria bacterium]|nr:hypothetical protein [Lentisphaeria bacterium]